MPWNKDEFLEQLRNNFGANDEKVAQETAEEEAQLKRVLEKLKIENVIDKKKQDDGWYELKVKKEKLNILDRFLKILGVTPTQTESINPSKYEDGNQETTPTPQPQGQVLGESATPTPEQVEEFLIDYTPYIEDQEKINAYYPKGIPQPPKKLLDIIRQVSPDDATRSAILKLTESNYNMNPADYTGNANGTIDRGTNMINSGTFDWLQGTPYDTMMKKSGIENYGDMFDPLKNENMMDIIRKVQGYKAWFGPRDKGFKHGL